MPERIPDEDYSWEMFSTHSSVTQLKPSAISEYVQEAEEHCWAQGDVAELVLGSYDQQEVETQDLGSMLLSKSTSLRKIHSYFSQLESRKCCLHLACQRSTSHSMRVVPTSRTIDDGSAKSSQPTSEVHFLENKDLRAFKHAYLCSVYPVLAAPEPPSPLSPSPIIHEGSSINSHLHRTGSYTSAGDLSSTVPSPSYKQVPSSASLTRPLTPYSLHDSGVEEAEEAGLIPMESVCEQLQRAFRLSSDVFIEYEHIIVKTYSKKSSQRLLAEELSGQLSVLESNSHPFYSPKHFITQNGYDLWQKQERMHISELLNKFWSSSLPFPRDNQDLIAELHSVHEDYHILLNKLLVYESQFRHGSGVISSAATFTPLSSASCRLLLEFGLRYGIGELYRKTLLLQCLSSEFSPAVGYLAFMNNMVVTIHQLLPSNKTAVVMVKQEFDMLVSSLEVLKVQACKALSQMKILFPAKKPAEGVELLLTLLRSVLLLMGYLAPANQLKEKFDVCLKSTVQNIFKPAYEMFKSVAQEDMNRRREGDLDPRLLNILIQDIREDVNDYKIHFESTFEKYFSISRMAATSFYHFLMKDVESLSQHDLQNRPLVEIDLRMLALTYRLNTLDSDWAAFVTPQEQTWRVSFLSNVTQWTTALRGHLQNLCLDAVAGDAYLSQKLDLPQPVLTYQTVPTPSDTRSISFSIVSISPSVNSAFSSIISVSSTPIQDCILESAENPSPECSDALDDAEIVDFGLTEYEMRPSSKQQLSSFDTRSLNWNCTKEEPHDLSAHRRFSLPVKLDEAKSDHQFTINQEYSDSGICSKGNTQLSTTCVGSYTEGHSPNLHLGEINCQGILEPTCMITSEPSDSDGSEQDEHDPSGAYESVDEEFTFPPLKIVSQRTENNNALPDFSKPVFSMPKSCEDDQLRLPDNARFLIKTGALDSLSSRASSITPKLAEDGDDAVHCIESDVLFPHSAVVNQAVMPVSGSVVDIMIMLQRMCCFSKNLVNVVLAESPLIIGSRKSSFQGLKKSYSSSNNNDQSSVDLTGTFPLYERNVSSVSAKSSRSAFRRPVLATNGDGDSVSACVSAQEGDGNIGLHQSVSHLSEAETNIYDLSPLMMHRRKLAIHLRMLKAMCNLLVVYTSNMICMDLCATPRAVAKRLIGPKLVELIESQQVGGLIWGCRHQAEATYDCLFYFNRKARLLSDCHEPVTQHMCTRINNVYVCLDMLDKYQKKLQEAFNIKDDEDTFLHAKNNILSGNAERRNSSVSEDFVFVNHQSVPDCSLMEDTLNSDLGSSDEDIQGCWSYQSKQVVEMTRQHIMATLIGMYKLLTFKLNLFVKDGLDILLHQKHPKETVAHALTPVTTFLKKYLDSLSTWMYHECFRRVLDNLWVLIVQGIELQADELKKSQSAVSTVAHNLMLTVSHLIKFMNNNGKGIKKDLLLAQASNVIFRLQLYTLSTSHLIALFQSLRDFYFEGDHLTLEENAARNPPAIIHRIHRELQSLRKSFSGAELVRWFIKNKNALPADLPVPSEHVTSQSAIIICQILLEQQFIVEVDSEYRTCSPTPISFTAMGENSTYPHVVIHSQGVLEIHGDQEISGSSSSASTIENIQVVQDEVYHSSSARGMTPTQQSSFNSITSQSDDGYPGCSKTDNETNDNEIKFRGEHNGITTEGSSQPERGRAVRPSGVRASELWSSEVQNSVHDGRKRNDTDSQSDDSYFEDVKRHTPFSSLTDVTFNNNSKKFVASSKKFYCIHQSILHQASTYSSSKSSETESERIFHKLKSSQENKELIEQCFTHKLSPVTIAAIIAGRRKNDSLAKSFLKQLPRTVSDKLTKLH